MQYYVKRSLGMKYFAWIRCYALGRPILKLQKTLLRWCLTVVCNIVGPMAKSSDNAEIQPAALNLFWSVCSNCQVWPKLLLALGWDHSTFWMWVGTKSENQTRPKKDTGLGSWAVSKFPLHHRDSVSCFYQPAHFCTCRISMLSQVYFLDSSSCL